MPVAVLARMSRAIARAGAMVVAALLGLPVLLLIPAAVVDRGPLGGARGSLFPLALTVWDPFVWVCARNSLIVALVVTAVSCRLGVALARTVGPWRFWGRGPFAALAWVPMAVAPAFAAIGIARIASPIALGRVLAARSGRALVFGVGWDAWIAWGLLVWVGIASATPIVALSVKAALGRIDPGWIEAGRALGASRRRAWRGLAWPIVRPEAARTLAAVFAMTLLEPGAPLVLGLRRTLAYQLVEAVLRGDPPARSAALALLGLALAVLGRLLIRWWGGPRAAIDPRERLDRPGRAGWWRATLSLLGLLGWSAFALVPLAGLVGIVVGAFEPGDRGWVVAVAAQVYESIDPDLGRLWRNALVLGLGATALAAALARGASARAGRRGAWPSLAVLAFERTPPLVFGVAAALLPGLIALAGDRLGLESLRQLATRLDPVRWPGLLLIAATAASRLPTLARAADRASLRARPSLAEAATALGASPGAARRLGGGRGAGRGVLVLTFSLAATSIAPALVLAHTTLTRPIGPAAVALADDPPRAAGLALGAVAVNLVGVIAARRGRSGPAGDWFRG